VWVKKPACEAEEVKVKPPAAKPAAKATATKPAAKATATKRKVSEPVKKQVASAQSWACKMCGEKLPGNYEIDHVVPLSSGGANDQINLQALCCNCHGEKTQLEKCM
jgi:5-methylcytosine-specific restriction protein A